MKASPLTDGGGGVRRHRLPHAAEAHGALTRLQRLFSGTL